MTEKTIGLDNFVPFSDPQVTQALQVSDVTLTRESFLRDGDYPCWFLLEYVVTRLQVTRCYASLSCQSIKHELK